MPVHRWHCDQCDLTVEVLRSISGEDYQRCPTEDELDDLEDGYDVHCPHVWVKQIGGNISVRKPIGWGSKGNW